MNKFPALGVIALAMVSMVAMASDRAAAQTNAPVVSKATPQPSAPPSRDGVQRTSSIDGTITDTRSSTYYDSNGVATGGKRAPPAATPTEVVSETKPSVTK